MSRPRFDICMANYLDAYPATGVAVGPGIWSSLSPFPGDVFQPPDINETRSLHLDLVGPRLDQRRRASFLQHPPFANEFLAHRRKHLFTGRRLTRKLIRPSPSSILIKPLWILLDPLELSGRRNSNCFDRWRLGFNTEHVEYYGDHRWTPTKWNYRNSLN